MTDKQTLAKKIEELEKRVAKLEGKVSSPAEIDDKELMEALYGKACELAAKNQKVTASLLQKKLWIDLFRAKRLIERLQAGGLIDKN